MAPQVLPVMQVLPLPAPVVTEALVVGHLAVMVVMVRLMMAPLMVVL